MKVTAALAVMCAAFAAPCVVADTLPDRMHLELVGQSSLEGAGKGGEGLALKRYGTRKVLFLAHESAPLCMSIIDVTEPTRPLVLKQIPVEASFVRCNSLALSGDTLIVARQTEKVGQPHGGIVVHDVSTAGEARPARPAAWPMPSSAR